MELPDRWLKIWNSTRWNNQYFQCFSGVIHHYINSFYLGNSPIPIFLDQGDLIKVAAVLEPQIKGPNSLKIICPWQFMLASIGCGGLFFIRDGNIAVIYWAPFLQGLRYGSAFLWWILIINKCANVQSHLHITARRLIKKTTTRFQPRQRFCHAPAALALWPADVQPWSGCFTARNQTTYFTSEKQTIHHRVQQ